MNATKSVLPRLISQNSINGHMRRALFGFLIATTTFLVGVRANGMIDGHAFTRTFAYRVLVAPWRPRFIPTGRGCGNVYVQGYQTNRDEQLSEGVTGFDSQLEANMSFENQQRDAVRIIERKTNISDIYGNLGDRVVLENPPNDAGQTSIRIIWTEAANSFAISMPQRQVLRSNSSNISLALNSGHRSSKGNFLNMRRHWPSCNLL